MLCNELMERFTGNPPYSIRSHSSPDTQFSSPVAWFELGSLGRNGCWSIDLWRFSFVTASTSRGWADLVRVAFPAAFETFRWRKWMAQQSTAP